MKRMIATALAAVMIFALSAGMAASAQKEKTVVTSFYPLYLFTLNLLKDVPNAAVQNLAAPEAGCLHDYQLTTKDMKTLAQADVFLVNGAGMESFLTDVAAQFPGLWQVVATEGMQVDENGNAHLWLTPMGAKAMVTNMAKGLVAALPEDAPLIEANLKDLLTRLDALDEKMAQGLAPIKGKSIVTFHEAFPYFAQAYGLNVAAVIQREPGEALSPAELATLSTSIKALNLPPLFVEPQYPDLAARTLSLETGAKVYTLDPIVTGPIEPGDALHYYEQTMLINMQTLLHALR